MTESSSKDKNVILITGYNRPELFYFCLKSLSEARHIENYKIIIALDYGYSPKYLELINQFLDKQDKEIIKRPVSFGSNRNISQGMKLASSECKDFFIILDDDHRVSKDFLELIEYFFSNFPQDDILNISGNSTNSSGDVEKLSKLKFYSQWGGGFLKSKFEEYISPHFKEEYYSNKDKYLTKNFPNFPYPHRWIEEDGLIHRIENKNNLVTVCPEVNRLQNLGFYGTNRLFKNPYLDLSFEERVKFIEERLSKDRIQELNELSLYYKDIFFMEEDHKWNKLYLT